MVDEEKTQELMNLTSFSSNKKENTEDSHLSQISQVNESDDQSFCNVFSKLLFPRLLMFSLARLVIYIHKLYQDANAVEVYYSNHSFNFLIISVISLVFPPLLYAIFLIGANLSKDDIVNHREVSTRTINGFLLIPWQIKRHLDMMHFASLRVCQWRKPNNEENEEIKSMRMHAEHLEFFEDFYSGFLQILLQLYLVLGTVSWIDGERLSVKPLIGQLIGSSLCVLSMMIAVRRRDDGKLTLVLSFVGWLCLIVSRVLVFALALMVIRYWLIVMCLIHVLAFSIWIYNIAIESYQISSSSVSTNSAQWTNKRKRISIAILIFLFFGIPSLLIWPIMFQLKERRRPLVFLLVVTMENLCLLGIWLIWMMKQMADEGKQLSSALMYLIIAIVISTTVGVISILVYVCCKPKYTDQVVLYEIRQAGKMEAPELIKLREPNSRLTSGSRYGIYYEFCDTVFKLPISHKFSIQLEEVRRMQAQM